MKLVADESVESRITGRLRANGHEVLSITEEHSGRDDEFVLSHSNANDAVLTTADKDFGELAFRQGAACRSCASSTCQTGAG